MDDEVGAQPAAVRAGHADLGREVHVLGHVGGLDAVAQLHLTPRAADLRALERRDERAGLVAQAPDLGAHRLEQLPHLALRGPAVVLEPPEVLRDRVQGPLDLLGTLGELPRHRRAIRFPLRRRQLLDLLGDLPQRVDGSRLHLLGELRASAGDEGDLLLSVLRLGLQCEARRPLALGRAAPPRQEHDRHTSGAGEQPEEKQHEGMIWHGAFLARG